MTNEVSVITDSSSGKRKTIFVRLFFPLDKKLPGKCASLLLLATPLAKRQHETDEVKPTKSRKIKYSITSACRPINS